MMQLTQVQLAQIVSSAVSQARSRQQVPAAVQQVQSPIKFEIPAFKGDMQQVD